MTAFLKTLLALTLAGSLCGLFLVALRKLSKGKVPNSFLYFAWIVVVLRFAVPLNGLIPTGSPATAAMSAKPSYSQQQASGHREISVVPSAYSRTDVPAPAQEERPSELPPAAEQVAPAAEKTVPVPRILFIIWSCGASGFLLWNVIPYARFASLMRKELSRPSRRDTQLYDEVYQGGEACAQKKRISYHSDDLWNI